MELAGEKSVLIVGGADKADIAPFPIFQYLYPFVPTVIRAVQDLAPALYKMVKGLQFCSLYPAPVSQQGKIMDRPIIGCLYEHFFIVLHSSLDFYRVDRSTFEVHKSPVDG